MRFLNQERLGLDSYRGRYLWLVGTLGIAMLISAYISNILVTQDTERNTSAATRSAAILSILSDADLNLSRLHVRLHEFTINPDSKTLKQLKSDKANFKKAMKRLHNNLAGSNLISLAHLEDAMHGDLRLLHSDIEGLISLRLSANDWMPARQILSERLIPQNEAIKIYLQNIESTLEETTSNTKIRLLVSQLRSAWLSTTGELRLLVSNRFGAFDIQAKRGMQARTINLNQYAESVRKLIAALKVALIEQQHEFLLDEHAGIQQAFEKWHHSHQSILVLLSRNDWRKDQALIQEKITPITRRIQQRLTEIREQLQTNTQAELDKVLSNSSNLATTINLAALATIVFFLLAYLAIDRWLFQPIQHIAEQLKREAKGTASTSYPKAKVKETRALVEAFAEMHNKVNEREQRLQNMAHHDPLTQLPNRLSFRKQLKNRLHRDIPDGKKIALLFLDLDRFKQVNDSHGHLVGDQLLVQVAKRLRAIFRTEDIVARISGDEFAVLLDNFADPDEITRMAEKVIKALKPTFFIEGKTCHSSASIGMAIAPEDGSDADKLIQHADAAMYYAKAAGRSGFCQFTHEMVKESTALLLLENELHVAIAEQQLELYLQPITDFRNNKTHAHECLLRWHHPKRGLVRPNDFLPTLEDIGLLQHIADWTFDQLHDSGITQHTTVSINLSAKLLYKQDFAESFEQILRQGHLQPNRVIVEITEDSFAQELAQAAQFLGRLQKLGVRVALDDFGTGQSSLNHLRAFPFDLVKIDQSFVCDIVTNNQDATLVRAIIALAKALDIEVVAEGIENPEQNAFIIEQGCQYGQGYLLGTPRPLIFDRQSELA